MKIQWIGKYDGNTYLEGAAFSSVDWMINL